MADLAIVGSEGLAKEIYSIIKELNTRNDTWNVLGFVSMQETGTYVIDDYRVVGNDTFLMSHRNKLAIVIAIGNPQFRVADLNRPAIQYLWTKTVGAGHHSHHHHPVAVRER